MKTRQQFWFPAVILFLGFVACKNDEVSPRNPPPAFSDDAWRVTWYWDQDKDETSDFAPFVFYFNSDNTLDAERNGVTTTGTWQITSDDGSQRLVIAFSADKPLSDLTDDWIITESTDDRIKLRDDNTTHLEELFFERQP